MINKMSRGEPDIYLHSMSYRRSYLSDSRDIRPRNANLGRELYDEQIQEQIIYPRFKFFKCSSSLLAKWLEGESGLLALSEGHTELEESHDSLAEVLEERIIVLRVLLNICLELLVLNQGHISRQHHQSLRLLVLELLWTIPLLPLPLLV